MRQEESKRVGLFKPLLQASLKEDSVEEMACLDPAIRVKVGMKNMVEVV